MARDFSELMWRKYLQALSTSSAGKGFDPTKVIPTGGLNPAAWEVMDIDGLPHDSSAPAKKGDIIVPSLMQIANVMPTFSPTYVPSSKNFYDQYSAFLNSIYLKGGNAAMQQLADGYSKQLVEARQKLSADEAKMIDEWDEFNLKQQKLPPSAQRTYEQWYNDNWARVINGDIDKMSAIEMKYQQALEGVGGPDYKTISSAINAAKLASGNSYTYDQLRYPMYRVDSSLNAFFVETLQAMASKQNPAINFTITLNDDDRDACGQSAYFNASAQARYSGFGWGGKVAASYSESSGQQEFDSLLQGTRLTFKAYGARIFTFSLGPWYNSAMISGFRDQISPQSALAGKPMAGPNGFLNLRTAQVLVVMHASTTITGSKTEVSQLYTAFQQQSSASISVGGMCWSASASMSQGRSDFRNDVKVASDGTSIELTDNTNAPKVLLVIPTSPAETLAE